jgi:hypothetical protein
VDAEPRRVRGQRDPGRAEATVGVEQVQILRVRHRLRAAGLFSDEARVAVDSMIASCVSLALRARAGALSREQAIDIHARVTLGLIRGLLATS